VPPLYVAKKMKIFVILALAFAVPALADSPLPPPSIETTKSANKRFEVVSDPEKGTRCIDSASSKELWKLPNWYRWSFLCDDGRHFITAYGGLNLLSQNYKGSDVMLTFWKDGKLVRTVTVDELIPDKKILQRTVSHYSWGSIPGITKNGLLEVILEDGSKHYFDPTTGRSAESKKEAEQAVDGNPH
jgi:hypothetical protein